ncbi:MAG: ATP-binding protein [Endomicrobium sp.]|jgi:AAA+ ATPase superfamily predicted ATPase|nr:ATP-binding protein [Endomicrobium sp.]
MKFLGRKNELEVLEREYQRDSSFVVIYGRRRVGKTTLIKEFIKGKNTLYHLATQELEQAALNRFAKSVVEFTHKPHLENIVFSDWRDLFHEIVDYKINEKKVIVIDELPYLVKINEAFPSILQYIWDEMLKDKNIMLILCGSYISMMEKYTLYHDSPLYGRRTAQIRLAPLSFNVARKGDDFETDVEQFAITGGVPKYLEFFTGNDTNKVIDEVILSKNGFLHEEPAFLLKEEVKEPITYFSILETIAKNKHKSGEIASILAVEQTSLSPYLSTLIDLGFVEKRIPITELNEEKSKKGLYYIADNFMRFWFQYLYPYKGELEIDNKQIVKEQLKKNFIENFVAFAYEDICKQIFLDFWKSGKIDFSPSKIGSYTGKRKKDGNQIDMQIDVVVVDNTNKRVFFGECKYYTKPLNSDIYFDLKNNVKNCAELLKIYKDYTFMYGIFSKSGFNERLLELAKENGNLYLIDKDKLINKE